MSEVSRDDLTEPKQLREIIKLKRETNRKSWRKESIHN